MSPVRPTHPAVAASHSLPSPPPGAAVHEAAERKRKNPELKYDLDPTGTCAPATDTVSWRGRDEKVGCGRTLLAYCAKLEITDTKLMQPPSCKRNMLVPACAAELLGKVTLCKNCHARWTKRFEPKEKKENKKAKK